jgi:hypothetical protein
LQNHFLLWTEPLFSVFVLLLVYCLIKQRQIWIVLVVCGLAFFLRKAGLFLFIGAATWYFLAKELRNFVVISAVMVLVFAGWEFLTMHIAHVSTSASIYNYLSELSRWHYVDAMSSWMLPRAVALHLRLSLILLAVTLIFFAFRDTCILYLKKKEHQLLLVITVVYVLCFSMPIGAPDYHEAERYLSVMLPLTMVIIISFCHHVYLLNTKKSKLFLVMMGFWCLYPVSRTIHHFL